MAAPVVLAAGIGLTGCDGMLRLPGGPSASNYSSLEIELNKLSNLENGERFTFQSRIGTNITDRELYENVFLKHFNLLKEQEKKEKGVVAKSWHVFEHYENPAKHLAYEGD